VPKGRFLKKCAFRDPRPELPAILKLPPQQERLDPLPTVFAALPQNLSSAYKVNKPPKSKQFIEIEH
jgi:hypothetical protein